MVGLRDGVHQGSTAKSAWTEMPENDDLPKAQEGETRGRKDHGEQEKWE